MLNSQIALGSVIHTSDDAFWYCAGHWKINNIQDACPCILAYIPLEEARSNSLKVEKTLEFNGRIYVKVFGRYGQTLEIYRKVLIATRHKLIWPLHLGRSAFVKYSAIVEVRDPRSFLHVFTANLDDAEEIFSELSKILQVPLNQMGLSGSNLVINVPMWRHENDFVIYGTSTSRNAFNLIEANRDEKTFSRSALPPFHTQFKFKNMWFDPIFSPEVETRHFFDGCLLEVGESIGEVTSIISEDKDGIFFPAVYTLQNGIRLFSFRISHRGLFTKNRPVSFSSLSRIILTYPDGHKEDAYGILDDEWATPG
ncbi:hypothetical protein C4546_04340 [Candidatus Parcubacteria bacterium]|jgi:hypothetical protein|nr:MAG: hypothetical protein C4546_04340 [Candidatus Parcubacteria bacterium]